MLEDIWILPVINRSSDGAGVETVFDVVMMRSRDDAVDEVPKYRSTDMVT